MLEHVDCYSTAVYFVALLKLYNKKMLWSFKRKSNNYSNICCFFVFLSLYVCISAKIFNLRQNSETPNVSDIETKLHT